MPVEEGFLEAPKGLVVEASFALGGCLRKKFCKYEVLWNFSVYKESLVVACKLYKLVDIVNLQNLFTKGLGRLEKRSTRSEHLKKLLSFLFPSLFVYVVLI